MGKLPLPKPERKPQGKAARRRADPEEAAQLIQGLHKLVTAFEALVKSTKHFETEAVRTCADTHAPRPPCCTYGPHYPPFCVRYSYQ